MKLQFFRSWVSLLVLASSTALAASDKLDFQVSFEAGTTKFLPGDSITVEKVTGTADSFRTQETYCVEGTYTLASREEAKLALFVTTRSDIRTPIDPRQMVQITKGTGSFRLVETMAAEGYPHVSFYPVAAGSSFGGVYFGQGDWLMKQSAFRPIDRVGSSGGGEAAEAKVGLSGANGVLLAYLGNPVEAPADLDAAYTPAGLREAVQSAAAKAAVELKKIDLDELEFPFLVGVTCDQSDFPKLKAALQTMPAYEFHGTVSSHNCYIFHLTPRRVWPADGSQRVDRRSTVRMERFYQQIETHE